MYYPLNYAQQNFLEGHFSPSSVKYANTEAFKFWERNLYFRLISQIDFKLPATWQGSTKDFFLWCVYALGYVMVSQDEDHGYFFQPATPKQMNFYYQPVSMVVSNPQMSREFTIGEDCEVLKLTPDYAGVFDIIDRYSNQLATLDAAISTNIINSKMAYVMGARTRAEANALKRIMDNINRGEPAVFYDRAITGGATFNEDEPFFVKQIQDVSRNYIVGEQLRDSQTILNAFDAEIGIITVPYQKAERLTQYEAQSKGADASSKIQTWSDCLTTSIAAIKELYPDIRLSFKLRGGEADGENDNYRDAGLDESE